MITKEKGINMETEGKEIGEHRGGNRERVGDDNIYYSDGDTER